MPAFAGQDQLAARQNFQPGGTVRMHLESGDYSISGTDSNEIVVTFNSLRSAHVKIEPRGSTAADVYVEDTPNNFHAEIELPKRSNIWLRLTAGDLNVADVEGDKDIEANAGDMNIEVPHPEQYRKVDASSLAGDINAPAFNGSKSGIFRSFDWKGPGQYHLHIHLMAGDINLRSSD
jgi:DUF4097 and DUF4098 domain-containing protein YvlB